ncbi:MAG: galactokinase [Terrimicrobiaceae bacterium]
MQFVSTFAPGRVELLGNHTDYNGGVVLSGAIDLGISVRGKRRDDGRIVLSSEGIAGVVEAIVDNLAARDSWADYPFGVAKILKDAGYPITGFEAHFSSTLPLGAGLSSSAAIEVSTAVLLTRLFDLQIAPLDLAKLCRRAENEFVGVSCGLLDQVSSIFGKKDHAIYLDCRAETVATIPFPHDVGLLIVHSGVKHALTGGEYNERRDQCFEAAKILGVPALRDATSAQLAAAIMPPLVKRRAAHIVGENERVFAAVEFLKQGDAAAFGRLMSASHRSSIENFENSTKELDALVEIACAQPGVYGARLTGGGFGGAIVALVDLAAIETIAQAVEAEYRQKTGHQGVAYRCLLGDGALAHD